MIYCERKTPHRLVEDIEPLAASELGKVVRRPFNRFQPAATGWWLVPSNDLPFYHHGKFYCDWSSPEMNSISCGFFLEKGLAPEVAVVYPSRKGKSLIMNDKWQWNSFAASCVNGAFGRALSAAAESNLPVEIQVSGGYVDDPALYDPYKEKQKKDHFIFDLGADRRTLEYRCAKRDAMVLKALNGVKCLDDFCRVIGEFSTDHFLWLNVTIAARFAAFDEAVAAGEQMWSAERIWNDFLKNFAPWIK